MARRSELGLSDDDLVLGLDAIIADPEVRRAADRAMTGHPAEQLIEVRIGTVERETGELALQVREERAPDRPRRALQVDLRASGQASAQRELAPGGGQGAELASGDGQL